MGSIEVVGIVADRGIYTAIAVEPLTNRPNHPSMLAALGMLPPTSLIDAAIMEADT